MFGLERAGLNDEIRNNSNVLKHIRIIQKNGKILSGEDFTSIAPQRPSTTLGPERPRTRQELHHKRRNQSLSELQRAFDNCKPIAEI